MIGNGNGKQCICACNTILTAHSSLYAATLILNRKHTYRTWQCTRRHDQKKKRNKINSFSDSKYFPRSLHSTLSAVYRCVKCELWKTKKKEDRETRRIYVDAHSLRITRYQQGYSDSHLDEL